MGSTRSQRLAALRRARRRQVATRIALAAGVAVAAVVAIIVVRSSGGDGETIDAGAGGLTGGDFHSIVVDPADPQRIYVGGHQAVSVSEDGGTTWTEISSLRDADAMGWAFTDEGIFVSGHPGLNHSADEGVTFRRTNDRLPHTDLHALGGAGDVLYAAGPGVGVIARSGLDGSWDQRTDQTGHAFFGRIAVDPDDTDRLVAADASTGVTASDDGGRTWRAVPSGLASATWLSTSSVGDEVVLVASGPDGAVRSTDGGRTWEPLDLPAGGSLVEASPEDPDTLFAGIHDGDRVGVAVSRDAGVTWAPP
ncbi:MAG: WD40/YVTN/BNR-like repeat-containing protein [Acidimicrobiales bacterium]